MSNVAITLKYAANEERSYPTSLPNEERSYQPQVFDK